nr:unnamed protein product [Callosobruchus chinensis]
MQTQSYSNAVIHHTPKHPNKDQAIIFNAVDGAKIQDYLLQLGPIVNPRNIKFCSRISNNRICIYLSSKTQVDQFLDHPGEIKINNEIIKARRMVTPADRLVISNVCPTLPHAVLRDRLLEFGINIISPITFLRIGAPLPEYSHILSFRRQAYITPTEATTIPDSLEITHEDLIYRIFLSLDSQKCYKCKESGHVASQCPSANKSSTTPPNPPNQANSQTTETGEGQQTKTTNYQDREKNTQKLIPSSPSSNNTSQQAAHKHIGKTKHLRTRNPVPWWNEDCEEAIRASKQALSKLKRIRTQENLEDLRHKRARARLITKKSQRDSWQKFVSSIDSSTPSAVVWRKIKSISGNPSHWNIRCLKEDSVVHTNKLAIAEAFSKTYYKNSSNENYNHEFIEHKTDIERIPISINNSSDPINTPISEAELQEALMDLKDTSPGPDDIPPIFLKNLPYAAKQHLLRVYNTIWSQHVLLFIAQGYRRNQEIALFNDIEGGMKFSWQVQWRMLSGYYCLWRKDFTENGNKQKLTNYIKVGMETSWQLESRIQDRRLRAEHGVHVTSAVLAAAGRREDERRKEGGGGRSSIKYACRTCAAAADGVLTTLSLATLPSDMRHCVATLAKCLSQKMINKLTLKNTDEFSAFLRRVGLWNFQSLLFFAAGSMDVNKTNHVPGAFEKFDPIPLLLDLLGRTSVCLNDNYIRYKDSRLYRVLRTKLLVANKLDGEFKAFVIWSCALQDFVSKLTFCYDILTIQTTSRKSEKRKVRKKYGGKSRE